MCKPKNRVMCPDCKRQKMLFGTQKEADLFIRYNGSEIDDGGKLKLRVYYCPACCGYHITSKPYKKIYEGVTDEMIDKYKKERKSLFDKLMDKNFKTVKEAKHYLAAQKGYSEEEKEKALANYKKYKGIKE